MTPQERVDFWTAIGKELGDAVVPPVPFEDATSQECCEVVTAVFGDTLDPVSLSKLSEGDFQRLAKGFGAHFECRDPDVNRIRAAIRQVQVRWPAVG